MGVQRVFNPLAGRCAREGSALPKRKSGQQSESRTGRPQEYAPAETGERTTA